MVAGSTRRPLGRRSDEDTTVFLLSSSGENQMVERSVTFVSFLLETTFTIGQAAWRWR
jgi:hypothetical protein